MKEYTEEYLNTIQEIVRERDVKRAKEFLSELHPADIAELFEDLEIDDAEFLNELRADEAAHGDGRGRASKAPCKYAKGGDRKVA